MDSSKQVKYKNVVDIAGYKLRCYILENGIRVFNQEDVEKMFEKDIKIMKVFCGFCDKEMPKIARILERAMFEVPEAFEALMKEKEKGLEFICETCEDEKILKTIRIQ